MSRSVLVVDDDVTFREIVARMLTLAGYRVIGEAGTVAEALARAGELRPDAALVDIGLPDGDGFALALGAPFAAPAAARRADLDRRRRGRRACGPALRRGGLPGQG